MVGRYRRAKQRAILLGYASGSPGYSFSPVSTGGSFSEGCAAIVEFGSPWHSDAALRIATDSASPAQDGAFRSYAIFPADRALLWLDRPR